MKGNNMTRNDHLIINNNKLIKNADNEEAHRQIWQIIFKISYEENQHYILTQKENQGVPYTIKQRK